MCLAQGTRDGCGGGEVEMVFSWECVLWELSGFDCLVWGCSNSDIEEIIKLVILVPVRDVLGIVQARPSLAITRLTANS